MTSDSSNKKGAQETLRVAVFAKGDRGFACLSALARSEFEISVVAIPSTEKSRPVFAELAKQSASQFAVLDDPNSIQIVSILEKGMVDLAILVGYPSIVRRKFLETPRLGVINLHAGKLPDYRGSSPLNWAIINNEDKISISIIKVDEGVDTGPIFAERAIEISEHMTIDDVHKEANKHFPPLLLQVLRGIKDQSIDCAKQLEADACYYPLRFPNDGLIFWDQKTAREVLNHIRALTRPYPCAYTYHNGKKVFLISAELSKRKVKGVPGRVYRVSEKGLLVSAVDESIWITEAEASDGRPATEFVKRYDKFATVQGTVEALINNQVAINSKGQ